MGYANAPGDVGTVAALQAHLGAALADVQRLENSTKRGNVIARLLLVGVKLLEVGDYEARLDAIEERLNLMDGPR